MKLKPNFANVLVLAAMFLLGHFFCLAIIGYGKLAIVENDTTCKWRGQTYHMIDIRPRTTTYDLGTLEVTRDR